ncbi:MAG: DUF1826 domain-containing protein [Pseudomonadota bacterium]
MNIHPTRVDQASTLAVDLPLKTVNRADQIATALHRATDAAIWSRTVPAGVHAWINELAAEMLPARRSVLSPDQVAACMRDAFQDVGVLLSPALRWIAEDAQALASHVARAANTPLVRMRLDPISNNACRLMHVDNIFARLICTYRGPGTELGLQSGDSPAMAQVPTGLPIYLKGKQWPGADLAGLNHRSPPIEGTGLTRWVLVLEGCRKEDIYPIYDEVYEGATGIG